MIQNTVEKYQDIDLDKNNRGIKIDNVCICKINLNYTFNTQY